MPSQFENWLGNDKFLNQTVLCLNCAFTIVIKLKNMEGSGPET